MQGPCTPLPPGNLKADRIVAALAAWIVARSRAKDYGAFVGEDPADTLYEMPESSFAWRDSDGQWSDGRSKRGPSK
jgi:hypothetical protein